MSITLVRFLDAIQEDTPINNRLYINRGDIFVNGVECKVQGKLLSNNDVVTRYHGFEARSVGRVGPLLQNEDTQQYLRMMEYLESKEEPSIEGQIAKIILQETSDVNGRAWWDRLQSVLDGIESAVSGVNRERYEMTGD